ncbi:hypothetical protein X975_12069, partial [Stegodyphus mimosarum]
PWPAALDYAVEDPWREQLDRDGPTDARLGLSQHICTIISDCHTSTQAGITPLSERINHATVSDCG